MDKLTASEDVVKTTTVAMALLGGL